MKVPSHVMVTGDDGLPSAVVDVDRLQSDATILMFQYAAAAGDDAEKTLGGST